MSDNKVEIKQKDAISAESESTFTIEVDKELISAIKRKHRHLEHLKPTQLVDVVLREKLQSKKRYDVFGNPLR